MTRLLPIGAVLLAAATALAEAPRTLGYQGRLIKADGNPVSGVTAITFAIYPEGANATKLWSEEQRLLLTDGYYATLLGETTPLPDAVFDSAVRFLELSVGGEALLPRQRISAVAFAVRSEIAKSVSGGSVDATSVAINGVPVIDSTGRLAGNAAYVSGQGITIDPQSRTVGLSAACRNGEVLKKSGDAWNCAPDVGQSYSAGTGLDLKNGAFQLTGACASGQVLKWDGQNWGCAEDANSPYAAGNGLALTGNTLSLTKACASSEILKWDGVKWACASDDGANYRAGSGIALGGGAISLTKACQAGEILKYDGSNWVCTPDDDTKYSAGSGLSQSGSVLSLSKDCAPGQVLKWDGTKWACAADSSQTYKAGGGMELAGNTFSLLTSCQSGQTLKWNGSDWACAGDKDSTYIGGAGVELSGNSFGLKASCQNGQVLKWNGSDWVCAADANSTIGVATGGGLTLDSSNNLSQLRTCNSGEILRWSGTAWACATDLGGVVTGGGLAVGSGGGVGVKSCSTGEILKRTASGTWDCAPDAGLTIANAASDTSLVITGGTSTAATIKTNTAVVQTRVTGTCAVGDSIRQINEDGSVVCTNQNARIIRYAVWDDNHPQGSWVMGNNAQLFGGVAPSNWGNGGYTAANMSNQAGDMRSLFTRKLWVGPNAMVHAETYTDGYGWHSSDASRHAAVFIRIKNSTSNNISLPSGLCLYYSSFASWSDYGSGAINGSNFFNGNGDTRETATCPGVTLPANRTSTIVVISSMWYYTNSSNFATESVTLGFYNNTLTMPAGLTIVDDLDNLADNTNIWTQ